MSTSGRSAGGWHHVTAPAARSAGCSGARWHGLALTLALVVRRRLLLTFLGLVVIRQQVPAVGKDLVGAAGLVGEPVEGGRLELLAGLLVLGGQIGPAEALGVGCGGAGHGWRPGHRGAWGGTGLAGRPRA